MRARRCARSTPGSLIARACRRRSRGLSRPPRRSICCASSSSLAFGLALRGRALLFRRLLSVLWGTEQLLPGVAQAEDVGDDDLGVGRLVGEHVAPTKSQFTYSGQPNLFENL